MKTRLILLAIGAAVLFCGWHLFGDSSGAGATKEAKKDKTVPVTVARASRQALPIEIRSIGNVLAYSVVGVIPQVSGQLSKVCFSPGQFVKKGQLLFKVERAQYEAELELAQGTVARDRAQIEQARAGLAKDLAQVEQLKANLQKDQAQHQYASKEVKRYELLVKEGAISHEQVDQINMNLATAEASIKADEKAIENAEAVVSGDRAMIDTARGTLQADEASLKTARIRLGWTEIRSPIDGRTSSLNIYEGNVVTANSTTPLVTIAQIEPIYVNFTVPEQELNLIRENMKAGKLEVSALLEGSKEDAVTGKVSFLENTVNTETGTVLLRAAFPNHDRKLFPGQFVDVVVSAPARGENVVVPSTALQTTQQGPAVYVVKPDNTVEFVPVTLLRTRDDVAAIKGKVAAGALVVTDGQIQLGPGVKVKVVKDQKSPKEAPGNSG